MQRIRKIAHISQFGTETKKQLELNLRKYEKAFKYIGKYFLELILVLDCRFIIFFFNFWYAGYTSKLVK